MDFPNLPDFEERIIYFHSEGLDFELPDEEKIISWITATVQAENKQLHSLNFIFCTDTYLIRINQKYLNHDTYTDVITFPYSENENVIEGDIFISLDRIQENAKKYNASFLYELKRIMIHGVLHLCGYGDKGEKEEQIMREKENYYLEK